MTDQTPSQELGGLLREWRENARLTQAASAEKIGVSAPSVSLHESGDRLPELDRLEAYSRLYGRSDDDLNVALRLLITARRARAASKAITASYHDQLPGVTSEQAA